MVQLAPKPKTLRELLPRASFFPATCEVIATTVCADASSVRPGGLYVLLDEFDASGADLAVEQGAVAIVAERLLPGITAPLVVVEDAYDAHSVLRKALSTPSHAEPRQSNPTQATPPLVLVAGSAGKSVTAKLLGSIFATAGAPVALWTSETAEVNGSLLRRNSSTPIDKQWREWLDACDANGAAIVAANPSETPLLRTLNPPATVACLTNLRADGLVTNGVRRWGSTQEHRRAIAQTLSRIDQNTPLAINAADADCVALASHHRGPLLTFGEQPHADIFATPLDSFPGGQEFLVTSGTATAGVSVGTPGAAYRSNCLAAIATGIAAGFDLATCVRGVERASAPEGMLEPLLCGQPYPVVLDRAMRPLALRASIIAARPAGGGRTYVAIQLSGDIRIASEQMAVAAKLADRVFATGDAKQVESLPSNVTIAEDRVATIAVTVALADEGDAVLIAGCTTETISTDRKITEQLLRRRLESDTALSDAA